MLSGRGFDGFTQICIGVFLHASDAKGLKKEPEFEMDEICTYAGKKDHKVWIGIVMHRATRPMVAFRIGDRSEQTCTKLWEQIPRPLRHTGTFFTDAYPTTSASFPKTCMPLNKKVGLPIILNVLTEHFGLKFSSLVRRSYSLAKSFDAPVGAGGNFIFNDNLELNAA
jgi:IS1 family transposase